MATQTQVQRPATRPQPAPIDLRTPRGRDLPY
jgi:hypothetical protein